MILKELNPRKALNKAFLRVKPNRTEIEDFKANLITFEFEKPKIVWGELSDSQKFAYDDSGMYANNSIFFITGNNLNYLLSILNSKVAKWYFNEISTSSGMGTNRWLKYKIELLPIFQPTFEQMEVIENLANKIISLKKQNPTADTTDLENQIDQLVYQLYNLTEEEINIIENA